MAYGAHGEVSHVAEGITATGVVNFLATGRVLLGIELHQSCWGSLKAGPPG